MSVLRTLLLFALAALAEIGGAWLIWQGVREHGGSGSSVPASSRSPRTASLPRCRPMPTSAGCSPPTAACSSPAGCLGHGRRQLRARPLRPRRRCDLPGWGRGHHVGAPLGLNDGRLSTAALSLATSDLGPEGVEPLVPEGPEVSQPAVDGVEAGDVERVEAAGRRAGRTVAKPFSRRTRRCWDTAGWEMPNSSPITVHDLAGCQLARRPAARGCAAGPGRRGRRRRSSRSVGRVEAR